MMKSRSLPSPDGIRANGAANPSATSSSPITGSKAAGGEVAVASGIGVSVGARVGSSAGTFVDTSVDTSVSSAGSDDVGDGMPVEEQATRIATIKKLVSIHFICLDIFTLSYANQKATRP
jgi:hypothetical protein